MKFQIACLVAFAVFTVDAADGPSFERFSKFRLPENSEISWSATTNALPPAVTVFKVVPQPFSALIISNLMALGSFTMHNERRHHGAISITNEDPLVFSNPEQTKSLSIVPAQGWIKYHDQYAPANRYDKVKHAWQPVEELPEGVELERRAIAFLEQLGFKRTDFEMKPNGTNFVSFGIKRTRSYFDHVHTNNVEDEQFYRGIFFIRRIDGIPFAGIGTGGGCQVCFGNHGKIADLEIIWRNLKPAQSRPLASPKEIIQFIRNGNAVLTHRDSIDTAEIKKFRVTEESLFYMGAEGESSQSECYPFAQLEGVAEINGTNMPVQLYCPALKTAQDASGSR